MLLRQLWPDQELRPERLRPVFAQNLAPEFQAYLCATSNDRVIGFISFRYKISLWAEGAVGWVDELVVDSDYRGRGVGSRLLREVMRLAQSKGCVRLELDSAFHREEAHRFYEKQGFSKRAFLFTRVLV